MKRDLLSAPSWKDYISKTIDRLTSNMLDSSSLTNDTVLPIVAPGAIVYSPIWGEGQIVSAEVNFPECQAKVFKIPYLTGLPDEISYCTDEMELMHERFGKGRILSYIIIFKNTIFSAVYPKLFIGDSSLMII